MRIHGHINEVVEAGIAFADECQKKDRHLSEWPRAELHCYALSQEVKRLRREIQSGLRELRQEIQSQ